MKKLIPVLLLFSFFQTQAQDKMEVIRCEAVDRSSPVTNIFIDESEQIWVGNRKGLNRVYAPDNGELVNMPAGEWSLLQTTDGNADLRFPLDELIGQMGDDGQAIASRDDRITCAIYDKSKGDLWVGTQASGLFQFETEPVLRLVKQHHSGNSKLGSDQINTLFIDRSGRLWIGTSEGACFGRYGKWRLEERFFDIRAFAQNSLGEVWVMGNDLLWRVDARQRWNPIDIEEARMVEGSVADIAFDNDDKLWVASEIVAQYDTETEQARIFGPAQEFTSQDVFSITVDSKNVVWIGTNDKGLYIIQKAATLYVSAEVSQYLKCNSTEKNASVKVIVDGGKEPYTYKWTNGASGQNPSNLGAGQYELTVTDSRRKTGRAKVTIPDPNIKVSVRVDKNVSADAQADGAATLTISGGQPDYSIQWDNGETTASATKLEPGSRSVKVTDKAGCDASASFTLQKDIGALNVNISQTKEIKCAGAKEAALKLEPNGGKAPFTYVWNASGLSGDAPQNLPAGQYEVTLTDGIGQTATASISVKEPEALSASVKVNAPASTGNSDGKATATAKGGNGSFNYKWSNGETAAQAVKLGPGKQTVTVTDANGCTTTASVDISENILPLSVSILPEAEIKCEGANDGQLKAEVSGGKPGFEFAWSGGTDTPFNADNEMGSKMTAGEYTVTVTDATGATASANYKLKAPKSLSISAKADAPASTGNADGKASAKGSGGTSNLSFKWSNGASGKSVEGLMPGEYTVTMTDANGCTATASVNISENILPLSVNISQSKEIMCAGSANAELTAEPNGGKPPHSFAWSGGLTGQSPAGLKPGKYTLTVTDTEGMTATSDIEIKEPKALSISAKADAPASTGNADGKASAKGTGGTGDLTFKWSNGTSGKASEGLAPGEYTVTMTDGNGCTATASVSISENILPLSASISQTKEVLCNGGSDAALQAEPNGGKPPHSFAWSGGLTGQNPTGLKTGKYSLTVTDVEGTTATSSFEITEPQVLSVELFRNRPSTTVDSKNGKAELRTTGGTTPISFAWDNGEATATVANLSAGIHSVTVSDKNGCEEVVKLETKTRINPELEAGRLRTGQLVKLDKIYFPPDSTNLSPESIPTMDELFEFMEDNKGINIEVGGHTNGVPDHEFCDRLSTDRAKAVAQYLVDKGLPANRLTYKGYGKRKPVATNKTAEGRAKNQRVEIKIVSLE